LTRLVRIDENGLSEIDEDGFFRAIAIAVSSPDETKPDETGPGGTGSDGIEFDGDDLSRSDVTVVSGHD
jgi:hypothetical protein